MSPTFVGGVGVVGDRVQPPRWWHIVLPPHEACVRSIRRTPLVLVAAGALALSACSDDPSTDPAPTDTETVTTTETRTETVPPSPTDTASPPASPSPTTTEAGVPSLSSTCELQPADAVGVESVTFAVPDGWQVEQGNCEFLDPALEQLEEGTEPDSALSIRIASADFAAVSDTDEIDGEIRWTGAISGYQAVRIRGDAAGQGIRPEGEPVQLYLVDLDTGTDEQGATLVMSAGPSSGASFELAAQALDRIAQTVRVTPNATDSTAIVVNRSEGGGTPFAVTYDQMEGCFLLHAGGPSDEVVDEACDVELDGTEIAGAILSDGDREVVAGLAPALAVLVESDAATAPYGGITTPVEGASLFSYEAIGSPLEVRAVDATGQTLATSSIG